MKTSLVSCPECDLLQCEAELYARGTARCVRCEAKLYTMHPHALSHGLAFALAAVPCFIAANCFPVAEVYFQGEYNAATIWSAVRHLYHTDMPLVALLAGLTAIALPALRYAVTIYILLPLHVDIVPRALGPALAMLRYLRRWSMVDVLVLALLVSLVKLRGLVTLSAGAGLWATVALMFLAVAEASVFDIRDVWRRVDEIARQPRVGRDGLRSREPAPVRA